MSERFFRLILGFSILISLFFELPQMTWAIVGLLIFEGLTNWRIPILVSKYRFGDEYRKYIDPAYGCDEASSRINFDAERMLRLIVATLMILTFGYYNNLLWFIPYFIGIMLFAAGISNICPMFLILRWIGFK